MKVPFLISISCSGHFAEAEIRADEREGEGPIFDSRGGSRGRKLGRLNERVEVPFLLSISRSRRFGFAEA